MACIWSTTAADLAIHPIDHRRMDRHLAGLQPPAGFAAGARAEATGQDAASATTLSSQCTPACPAASSATSAPSAGIRSPM
jgi:hypothetical protein